MPQTLFQVGKLIICKYFCMCIMSQEGLLHQRVLFMSCNTLKRHLDLHRGQKICAMQSYYHLVVFCGFETCPYCHPKRTQIQALY